MAVPAQVKKAIEHDNRRANEIRSRPGYKSERAKWDRIASEVVAKERRSEGTINDTINEIERDVKTRQARKCWGEVRVRYIHACRACATTLPKGCPDRHYEFDSPLNGKHYVEDPFLCPSCGYDPWRYSSSGSFNIVEFKTYYDLSLGKDAVCPAGVRYVPGKGHEITSLKALETFARVNGKVHR